MQSSKSSMQGLPALIALVAIVFLGMPLLRILYTERPWSTFMLLAIAVVCGMRLLQTLRTRHAVGADRLLATREATAVIAALVACIAAGTGMSWARGTAIVATSFVFLIEYLRLRQTEALDPGES